MPKRSRTYWRARWGWRYLWTDPWTCTHRVICRSAAGRLPLCAGTLGSRFSLSRRGLHSYLKHYNGMVSMPFNKSGVWDILEVRLHHTKQLKTIRNWDRVVSLVEAFLVLTSHKSILVARSLSKRSTIIFLVTASRHIFNLHSVLFFIREGGFFYFYRQDVGHAYCQAVFTPTKSESHFALKIGIYTSQIRIGLNSKLHFNYIPLKQCRLCVHFTGCGHTLTTNVAFTYSEALHCAVGCLGLSLDSRTLVAFLQQTDCLSVVGSVKGYSHIPPNMWFLLFVCFFFLSTVKYSAVKIFCFSPKPWKLSDDE